jgi:diaminohydroxyphosphoribosylaminopyrimidine deaminase/5-amino-6-(5-phosphoribosylamino)uracil reductase
VEVVPIPGPGRVAIVAMLRALARRGVTSLLVEGGGAVAAAMLRARQVDRIAWFVAPAVLGDDGVPAVGGLGVDRVRHAVRVVDVAAERLGDDVLVTGSIAPVGGGAFLPSWPPR